MRAIDARHIGGFLARGGVAVDAVRHSGKLRAQQTAELLAGELAGAIAPSAMDGLGATDPTGSLTGELAQWHGNVVLVSHQPFVGRLIAALLGTDEAQPPVAFTPGTVVAVERDPEVGYQVAWMLRPELLR